LYSHIEAYFREDYFMGINNLPSLMESYYDNNVSNKYIDILRLNHQDINHRLSFVKAMMTYFVFLICFVNISDMTLYKPEKHSLSSRLERLKDKYFYEEEEKEKKESYYLAEWL
jgi:hypothetical protein